MFRLENKYFEADHTDENEISDEQCLNAICEYEEQDYETRRGSPSFWKEERNVLHEISEADYYELLEYGTGVRLFKYPSIKKANSILDVLK